MIRFIIFFIFILNNLYSIPLLNPSDLKDSRRFDTITFANCNTFDSMKKSNSLQSSGIIYFEGPSKNGREFFLWDNGLHITNLAYFDTALYKNNNLDENSTWKLIKNYIISVGQDLIYQFNGCHNNKLEFTGHVVSNIKIQDQSIELNISKLKFFVPKLKDDKSETIYLLAPLEAKITMCEAFKHHYNSENMPIVFSYNKVYYLMLKNQGQFLLRWLENSLWTADVGIYSSFEHNLFFYECKDDILLFKNIVAKKNRTYQYQHQYEFPLSSLVFYTIKGQKIETPDELQTTKIFSHSISSCDKYKKYIHDILYKDLVFFTYENSYYFYSLQNKSMLFQYNSLLKFWEPKTKSFESFFERSNLFVTTFIYSSCSDENHALSLDVTIPEKSNVSLYKLENVSFLFNNIKKKPLIDLKIPSVKEKDLIDLEIPEDILHLEKFNVETCESFNNIIKKNQFKGIYISSSSLSRENELVDKSKIKYPNYYHFYSGIDYSPLHEFDWNKQSWKTTSIYYNLQCINDEIIVLTPKGEIEKLIQIGKGIPLYIES